MARLESASFTTTLTAIAAACLLAACGGDGGTAVSSNNGGSGNTGDNGGNGGTAKPLVVKGVVASTFFTPGSATEPTITGGVYSGALVCVDANDNGKCDTGEAPAKTDDKGQFTLTLPTSVASALIADIPADAINTAGPKGTKVGARLALRVSKDQVADQAAGTVVISAFSSELQRMVEASNSSYAAETKNLMDRVGVSADVVKNPASASSADKAKALAEANALTNRFAYATAKFDRGDKYPDALAVAGGNPELTGLAGVTTNTANVVDTRKAITFEQAQQAAFNVEGIPRYDNIFIIMLENKGSSTIVNSRYAPKINGYLRAGNQLTSYFATGNPSEPNYTALGGADDFGIVDDSQWNCDATGPNAVQDLPLPDNTQPGLAASPFKATCVQNPYNINHNIVGKPNLFNAITSMGMTWRTYNESTNPGQDYRTDSVADPTVSVPDHVYQPGEAGLNTTVIGNAKLMLPLPGGLYKTKHHPGAAYQNVRSAPEWKYSNRTLGGGQWDSVLLKSKLYAHADNFDIDQFSTDLASGNVGNLNFVIPDQCDDMHSIGVSGTDDTGAKGTASDCSGVAGGNSAPVDEAGDYIITRGDNYVDYLVKKIQGSPLWKNPQKRVAIVMMFDEGGSTAGFNSCCGWNPNKDNTTTTPTQSITVDPKTGKVTVDDVHNYTAGNRGHGESIFGILTNQANAPKGVKDSDAYSHFSFVRTLQDMFQLADPANDATYMNRSKYTEKFIAQHIANLPEYLNSADTHFDAVRPINHAFVSPATYAQKQAANDTKGLGTQVGPDANQYNVWAITK